MSITNYIGPTNVVNYYKLNNTAWGLYLLLTCYTTQNNMLLVFT